MKPQTLLTLAAFGLVIASTAWGQATFQLRNHDSIAGVDAPIFDSDGVPLSGADYAAELWGGYILDALSPAVYFTADGAYRLTVPFQSGNSAGYFRSARTVTIASAPEAGYAWLQVRAWDTRLGPTYEAAVAAGLGGHGESAPFYARGGSETSLIPPGPLIGLESFSLRAVVPEPGAWALLLLGVPAWLWSCRGRRRRPRPSA